MVWMRHREHGGVAQFPAAASEAWQALGWEPSDPPPPDPDPAMVEHQPVPTPEPPPVEPAPTDEPKPKTTTKKTEE